MKKAENYQLAIEPEMTKSPNYSFSVGGKAKHVSPIFTHGNGDILVNIVTTYHLNETYTDHNFTINFGYISSGSYYIRILNADDVEAAGNFSIYY